MVAPRAYADVSAEQWFAPAVSFATAKGLFRGIDEENFAPDISGRGNGVLDPDGNATRAEAAQLLKNFLINY